MNASTRTGPRSSDASIPKKVLVIDDEPQLRRLLKLTLESEGFAFHEADKGVTGLTEAAFCRPDIVILDLGLPDLPGIEVIKRLREWSSVPILVLSVRVGHLDKIAALDNGAEDYLTKPFDPSELLARIRVLLRRQNQDREPSIFRFGDVQIDLVSHIATKAGQEVPLTNLEYALLGFLVSNHGKIVTHQQILRELWGPRHENQTNYLRVYMRRLRKKLEDNPDDPKYLLTASGFGYRVNFVEPADVAR